VSTRLVGAVIMTHSDDTGLVLPPAVAPIQVVIVPVWRKNKDKPLVDPFCAELAATLRAAGVRVHVDDRDKMKPGAKYYEWERAGVPLRMEVGPRDVQKGAAFCKKRTGGDKFNIPVDEAVEQVLAVLEGIQAELLENALHSRQTRTQEVADYATFKQSLEDDGGWFLVPWCDDSEAEQTVKEQTKATIRCFPLDKQADVEGKTCFFSGRPATHMAIFAKAY
jgi:prolyl-tRNA synthetase